MLKTRRWRDGTELIRPLKPDDAAALQVLFEHCSDYSLLADGTPPAPDAGAAAFADVPSGHSVNGLQLSGAFADGELIGMQQVLRGYPDDAVWWIGLQLVDPDWRGQGIGRDLLLALLRDAGQHGIQRLQLGVLEANPRARRFWERLGFGWLRTTEPRLFGERQHVVHVLEAHLLESAVISG